MGRLKSTAVFGTLLALCAGAAAAGESLGPGTGAWRSADPSSVGLSAAKLERAAAQIRARVPERYCLLVAKHGRLVHESYFANSSQTVYESDSAGKTFTAALIGVLVHKGLVDIDRPIREYGVRPRSVSYPFSSGRLWNKTGGDYFERVTARHILSQSSGFGLVEPGSWFTYDSNDYIQHLSYLISAVTGQDAVGWAQDNFATPLGIPNLYDYDNDGIPGSGTDAPKGDMSAGGGQMVTCRDLVRLGQLLLNRGTWLDADGEPYRLIPAWYADAMMRPSFSATPTYGLLMWLNNPVNASMPKCCAPRWGGERLHCNSDKTSCTTCCTTNCDIGPGYPCDLDIKAMHEKCSAAPNLTSCLREGANALNKQIVGDSGLTAGPDDLAIAMGNFAKYMLVVPSLGITVSSLGHTWGASQLCDDSYDDAWTLGLIWNFLAPAVHSDSNSSHPVVTSSGAAQPPPVQPQMSAQTQVTRRQVPSAEQSSEWAGSCSCLCPPGQGFGRCFNVKQRDLAQTPTSNNCSHVEGWYTSPNSPLFSAGNFCPNLGVAQQCDPTNATSELCKFSFGGMHNCTMTQPCESVPSSTGAAIGSTACTCQAREFERCHWSSDMCDFSPYFPP